MTKASELTLEQRIAFAAIQFHQARRASQHLADRRSRLTCERAECEYEARTQDYPCWKNYRDTCDGDRELDAEERWCEPCRQRQAVHLEYRKATVKRGARQRELHRLCELAGGWQVAPTIKLMTIQDSPLNPDWKPA